MAERDKEAARLHAWWFSSPSLLEPHWNAATRKYDIPAGEWPPGVDPDTYDPEVVSARAASLSTPAAEPAPAEDPSPSVDRFRQKLNGRSP